MRYPNQSEWLALIEEFRAGELTVKEFIAKQDVSKNTFEYWLYRKSKKLQNASGSTPQFLPVTVVASAALKARRSKDADGSLIEVAHNGIVCRFEVGTDTRYVAELLAALG